MYKLGSLKVQLGDNAIEIKPLPLNLADLAARCRLHSHTVPENPTFLYHDSQGDRIRLHQDSDLLDLYKESASSLLFVKGLASQLQSPPNRKQINLSSRDEDHFNLSLLVTLRGKKQTIKNLSCRFPTDLFYRVAQHITHMANTLGCREASEFFKVPAQVTQYLQLISAYQMKSYFPLHLEPPVEHQIKVEKIYKAYQRLRNGEITKQQMSSEFKVPKALVKKWIRVFARPPRKKYLTLEYLYNSAFRKSLIEDYLLDKYSLEEIRHLFGLNEKMVIFWVFCEADPSQYFLVEIDHETLDPQTKEEICSKILSGEMKLKEAVEILSVRPVTVSKWIESYKFNKTFKPRPRGFAASETFKAAYNIFKKMIEVDCVLGPGQFANIKDC